MQKLNMQNNCFIIPRYLRSLGHRVTPLVNYKSLSLSQRPRDCHYREVCQCQETRDGMETPKQILTELTWLWHVVHRSADILRWVPKPVCSQWTEGERKVKSQPAKNSVYGCSPISGDGSGNPSGICTCAAWRSCSCGLGVSRHTTRETKVTSKLKTPVMAGIWFERVLCHTPRFHNLKIKLFYIKTIPFISKNNCFQKPEKNVRPGNKANFYTSFASWSTIKIQWAKFWPHCPVAGQNDNYKGYSCICAYSLKTYGRISCLQSPLLGMIRKKQTAHFCTKLCWFLVLLWTFCTHSPFRLTMEELILNY